MKIAIVFLVFFVLVMLLIIPVSFSMGIPAALSVSFFTKVPLFVIIQRMFVGLDSIPLLAVPFFMFAGGLMTTGGISKRLVDFGLVLIGHKKGGLAISAVFASMIFAGITGSAAADTGTFCKVVAPEMYKHGYKKGFIAALLACSGTNGPIIPPSIVMVIYGSITGLSIGALFMAGVIPGILIAVVLMFISWIYAKKHNILSLPKASFREIWKCFLDAFWALIIPVVIISGIMSGVVTPTEAGMLSVFIAFVVGMFIYKELKWKDIPRILYESAYVSFCLLFIAATASAFSWVLARLQFPSMLIGALVSISTNPQIVLVLIIFLFLILGTFMETLAAMIIFVPILHPLTVQFGYDPVHFALIILMTLMVGVVTPPVGVLTSLSCQLLGIEVSESLPYLAPMVLALIVLVLFLAFVPGSFMFMPRLLLNG
jgi:tripartite ATP-independent transporter DctM subunit